MKASKLGGGRTRVDKEGGRFAGLTSKPGAGRFTGLGLKTGCASGAVDWQWWRARGVIVKFASRRRKVVKVARPSGGRVKI